MTIVSTTTVEQYAGDGVQAEWPVTFPFHRPEDVRAVVTGVGGDRVLTYGADYTVAALPGGGGSMATMPGTPGAPGMVGAGEQLTLWLDQPFTQEMDLRNTGVLDAEMLERGFDRLTLMAQQLREEVGRCVKVPLTDQATRTDELLAGIAANVGRAEMATLEAEGHAASASADAARAEGVASGLGDALAGVLQLREEVEQAVADARQDIASTAAFVPIGAILDFPVHTVSGGFLPCAGQTVAREAYPDLVAYLTGDPLALSATLPDLRGEFRRGADLGRGVDAGRVVGSTQGAAVESHGHEGSAASAGSHGHDLRFHYAASGSGSYISCSGSGSGATLANSNTYNLTATNSVVAAGAHTHAVTITPSGGVETRPRNIAVVACIKAYHAPMSAAPVDLTDVLAALDAIRLSGAEAKQPQTILRCRMKSPMAPPFHDLALPDFLSFSGLVVTLLADPATPFAACFGNGGASVASEITGNLSVALPAAAATQWLYAERNPDTGALSLGATDTPPEYGAARRGVAEPGNYTGYTGKWGTVAASTEYAGGGNPAWKALDGSYGVAGAGAWWTASGVTSGWWRLTLDRKRRIRGYEMVGNDDGLPLPRAWNIKVTSNGVQTTVDSVTGAAWSASERKRRLIAVPVDCDVLEVECLNSGREYVGMMEFVPIFDEDWYSPPENSMRRADGAQVQRVYVGKAVVSGGAVAAVAPFHPGVLAVVPVGSGMVLAAATSYTEHNPLGCPVHCDAEAWHAAGAAWLPVHYVTDTALTNNRGGVRFSVKSGASVKLRTGGAVIAGDGEYIQQNTALVRMIARRVF